ncbi:hypothetical protein BMS3Abin05_00606 [bacterium BMS3Abin05]|nr:hypothetical protein BMS3Abin05_00606 [bacterium BMS3Abin05]GBE28278.1 hypothetical protein BMS3Bbin03_02217 [bacterium BMS3Bbin03]
MLEQRINLLKQKIVEYAFFIENMIHNSIKGLMNKNRELLEKVINDLEPKANDFEIELDELCTSTIAQFGPKAKNLRSILMIAKMNNDLERIGDQAVNISECGLYLIEKPPVKPLVDIPRMGEEAVKMLSDAIDSFINENITLAESVCERDNIVDNLRDQILRELITFMTSDPVTIERSIHLIKISRNLERIADLSTNICEDVIFMIEGKIIKHRKIKD